MMEAEGIRLQELYAVIDEAMGTEKMLQGYDRSKKEEIHRMSKREQDIRLLATDGSEEAREFTKNRIYLILSEMPAVIDQNNIDSILSQYHVDYFTNLYTASREENIKKPIDREVEEYFNKFSISRYDSFEKKLMKLAQVLYQELYGYSIVDELVMESELNEVACNRYDYIWIQYKGIKRRVPNPGFRFADEEYYKKIIENRLTSSAREEMNAGEPIIYSTLLNGSRVTALRPPLSRYFVVNIRLFNGRNSTNANRNRFMEDKMQRLIELLAGKGRRNVAIIGEQGSGKTTGADEIIIRSLDDDLSIGLAENIHELNISGSYLSKNVVELQYTRNYKPSDITEMFFRLNRDVIIYGEVRNALEAFEMIKAMLRQARGSLFTFHSSSVHRMIHDLRQLLMQTGYYTDYREAQFDGADAVDLVIHIKLDRGTGKRYTHKISEVAANSTDMSFEVHDLFVYDKEKQKYRICKKGLTGNALDSCMEYEMTNKDREQLRELFEIRQEEEGLFEYAGEAEI
jgi:pilus assembly protein CpaF